MQNLNARIALVTGANKGIGLEIARQLGSAGHRILLGARNATLGQDQRPIESGVTLSVHCTGAMVNLSRGEGDH